MQIGLVEDDPDQSDVLQLWLETAGHEARCYATGREFMEAMRSQAFDLALVDWVLPDCEGGEVIAWIRSNLGWDLPVIVATARNTEADVVAGLQAGADDYLAKPLKQMELLARIDAVARRRKVRRPQTLQAGAYEIDTDRRIVRIAGKAVELTQKELDLAYYLFSNPNKLFSRNHLLDKVWGLSADVDTRTVDTHVSRLRRKLLLGPEHGWQLTPVYGYGYRMERVEGGEG